MAKYTARKPLSHRDFLILFALLDGERHGYVLMKDVEEQSEGVVRIDPANLYRSVRRMLDRGLIEESDRRPARSAADGRT